MEKFEDLYVPELNKRPEDLKERRQFDCDLREKFGNTILSDDCEDLVNCDLCIFAQDNFEVYKRYEKSKPF